ncbi:MAG: hypothetical protein AAFV53_34230, partial [Myxococcota bacterium]
MRQTWIAVLLIGCSDYDLHRPDDPELGAEEYEEPEPEVPSDDPDIEVEPMTLDFGSVMKDCWGAPLTVTVTNKGKADLAVEDIMLTGDGASAFSLIGVDESGVLLAQDESMAFEVNFNPNAWLDYDLHVDVLSNDPDESRVRVDTLGTGARGSLYEEDFVQEYNEEVDVLWVVDNSCSMSDEVSRIASNFNTFIDEFIRLDLDYHIGVITTDMVDSNDQGRLQGPFITPSTPDPQGAFTQQTDQGSSGSADEQGFAAVQSALSDPLLSGHNAGFLREDAALSVIVVSDEDDSSGISAGNFTNFLFGLK